MLALALVVLWGGYTITLWGYCLIRGYDVTFADMFTGVWPPEHGSGTANGTGSAGSAPSIPDPHAPGGADGPPPSASPNPNGQTGPGSPSNPGIGGAY